jgi:hypothetical protein
MPPPPPPGPTSLGVASRVLRFHINSSYRAFIQRTKHQSVLKLNKTNDDNQTHPHAAPSSRSPPPPPSLPLPSLSAPAVLSTHTRRCPSSSLPRATGKHLASSACPPCREALSLIQTTVSFSRGECAQAVGRMELKHVLMNSSMGVCATASMGRTF